MIAEALHALLTATGSDTLANTVGRVYIAQRPPGTAVPALVVEVVNEDRRPTAKLTNSLFFGGVATVYALASTSTAAELLADAVQRTLDGHRGDVTAGTKHVTFHHVRIDSRSPMRSDHRDGQGTIQTHGIRLDFDFLIERATL